MSEKEVFQNLFAKNVNEYTEEKNGLSYLSWANAWAEVKKEYPDASYEIKKFDNHLPYVFDEKTGYMVFTSVTIENQTHEMWLAVMDYKNNAMKHVPYTFKQGGRDVYVQAATMFDINKAIMRCLTKNLAMFGLGLYIYAGEDLPEGKPIDDKQIKLLKEKLEKVCELYGQDLEEGSQKLVATFTRGATNKLEELNEKQSETFNYYLAGLINKHKSTETAKDSPIDESKDSE